MRERALRKRGSARRHLLCGRVRDGVREVIELLERFVDGVLVQVEAAQRVHDTEATTSEHARMNERTHERTHGDGQENTQHTR